LRAREGRGEREIRGASRPKGERENRSPETGKFKKVSTTNPDATIEPAYKQHVAVDDVRGVILDVDVTTGEVIEGQVVEDVSMPPW
jgi:hypothetical protein